MTLSTAGAEWRRALPLLPPSMTRRWRLPEKLLIMEELPRNPVGKVLTQTLKERVAREEI